MQNWHIYKKWNSKLFMEMYSAYVGSTHTRINTHLHIQTYNIRVSSKNNKNMTIVQQHKFFPLYFHCVCFYFTILLGFRVFASLPLDAATSTSTSTGTNNCCGKLTPARLVCIHSLHVLFSVYNIIYFSCWESFPVLCCCHGDLLSMTRSRRCGPSISEHAFTLVCC
jgi:hypothetical protein